MPAMGPQYCSGNASSKPSWFLKLKHWCGKSYRQCNYHAGPCLVQVVAAHLSIDLDWATTPQASALRHEVCGRLRPCATRTTFIMTRACCAGGGSNSLNKISPRKIWPAVLKFTTHIMKQARRCPHSTRQPRLYALSLKIRMHTAQEIQPPSSDVSQCSCYKSNRSNSCCSQIVVGESSWWRQ